MKYIFKIEVLFKNYGQNNKNILCISKHCFNSNIYIISNNFIRYEMKINWNKIREDFFRECTYKPMPESTNTYTQMVKFNMVPHDLFEWFK